MGSGFCAVNPMRDSAPGLFTFLLVAGFALCFAAGGADNFHIPAKPMPPAR